MITEQTVTQWASYGGCDEDSDLYADDQDIQEYTGQSSIGFDSEYLIRELLYLLTVN